MLLRILDAEVETELQQRHRGEGGQGPLGCVKAPSEQSLGNVPPPPPPPPVRGAQLCPVLVQGCAACVGRGTEQGGSCAGLGSHGCAFIYTHNQFTASGQSFIPCMGRFGLKRDISTRESGNVKELSM